MTTAGPPVTPDGRYFVVRGRLWRCADPKLPEARRATLVHALMDARRDLRGHGEALARADARRRVDEAKRGLGERGPVWWRDGAPDYNRHLAKNTPYAAWFSSLAPIPADPAVEARGRRTKPAPKATD